MSKYVWVSRGENLGQYAVDLHQCLRFLISDPTIHEWAETLCIYYLDPNGRWLKHSGDMDPVHGVDKPWEWVEWYEEVDPVIVTHDMLWRYDGRLPPELESHREIASDPGRYAAFRAGEIKVDPERGCLLPSWDAGTRRLSVGAVVWEAFTREAENQSAILDAFERAGWPESIANPLDSEEKLSQTIKDFNKKAQSSGGPLRLRRENCRVRWKLADRIDESMTP